ncbi:MAG TPA: hypothetical protein VJ777_17895, partial [Mycobacterium sp.]|nr:hypothetical protein [Mycobacterium sp.]
WVSAHPGERPWGWWRWNAPGPRECLDGDEFVYAGADWIWRGEFGLPNRPQMRGRDGRPERMTFEGQATYLERLGMLLPGELEQIPEQGFAPETIEIPSLWPNGWPEVGRPA